jgi:hypothetical protein
LIPAVFFEDYAFLKKWMGEDAGRRGFRSIGGFVDLILVQVDATLIQGRITVLDHFLAVTAREVLQKIKVVCRKCAKRPPRRDDERPSPPVEPYPAHSR